jgi:DUF971 family protein
MTGRQILIATSVSETISPTRMYSTGNYALSVDWSDGHKSLYPYRQIKSLMEAKKAEDAKLQEVFTKAFATNTEVQEGQP